MTGHDGAVLAALIALIAGPRKTFRFVGQLVLALTLLVVLGTLVLVGLALLGG